MDLEAGDLSRVHKYVRQQTDHTAGKNRTPCVERPILPNTTNSSSANGLVSHSKGVFYLSRPMLYQLHNTQ